MHKTMLTCNYTSS